MNGWEVGEGSDWTGMDGEGIERREGYGFGIVYTTFNHLARVDLPTNFDVKTAILISQN